MNDCTGTESTATDETASKQLPCCPPDRHRVILPLRLPSPCSRVTHRAALPSGLLVLPVTLVSCHPSRCLAIRPTRPTHHLGVVPPITLSCHQPCSPYPSLCCRATHRAPCHQACSPCWSRARRQAPRRTQSKTPSSRVRAVSRTMPPRLGSIRFRSPLRAYDAPPWGVRVVPDRLTKSRKTPTRKILPRSFLASRSGRRPGGGEGPGRGPGCQADGARCHDGYCMHAHNGAG